MKKFLLLAVCAFISAVTACGEAPIKIGVFVPLTGARGHLGPPIRNGVRLAVDEINAAGGINGRPVEIIIKNNDGDRTAQLAVAKKLADLGAVGIIGPIASQTAMDIRPFMKDYSGVVVSPTASTSLLNGKKDNFFRTFVNNTRQAEKLADYAVKKRGLMRAAVFGDLENEAYLKDFNESFIRRYTALGGEVRLIFNRSFSERDTDWESMAKQVAQENIDVILLSVQDRLTGLFAKVIRKQGSAVQILAPGMPATKSVLTIGEEAVEHMVFSFGRDEHDGTPAYDSFKKAYQEKYGPFFQPVSIYGYDAAQLLLNALKEAGGDQGKLKAVLARGGAFTGVQGAYVMDEFGDIEREGVMTTIVDGQFVPLTE